MSDASCSDDSSRLDNGEPSTGGPEPAGKPYGIAEYRRQGEIRGWKVSMRRRGVSVGRCFTAREYGSLGKALDAAIAFRDHVDQTMVPISRQAFCATLRSNNTSGVPGVFRVTDRTGEHWKAGIRYADGRTKTRQFSIARYGEAEAYRRAVEARRQLLEPVGGVCSFHPDGYRKPQAEAEAVAEVVRSPFQDAPEDNPFAHEHVCDVPGVQLTHVKSPPSENGEQEIVAYWTAVIKGANGLPIRRYFSVKRYGEAEAKRLAIEQRLAWNRQYDPVTSSTGARR